jgi:ribosome-binding factor A
MDHKEDFKQERTTQEIKEAVARFVQRESSNTSLVTVTRLHLGEGFKNAIIFVTVLPENQEQAVVDFLNRKRREIQHMLRKETKVGRIPHFEVRIDEGEKSRQRLDELANE